MSSWKQSRVEQLTSTTQQWTEGLEELAVNLIFDVLTIGDVDEQGWLEVTKFIHPLRFIIKIKMMMILVRGFEKGLWLWNWSTASDSVSQATPQCDRDADSDLTKDIEEEEGRSVYISHG